MVNCSKIMIRDDAEKIEKLLCDFYKSDKDEKDFPTIIVANEDISDFYKNLYFYVSPNCSPDLKIRIPILHTISKSDAIALIIEIYNEHKIQIQKLSK